jgi:hypothetical protein
MGINDDEFRANDAPHANHDQHGIEFGKLGPYKRHLHPWSQGGVDQGGDNILEGDEEEDKEEVVVVMEKEEKEDDGRQHTQITHKKKRACVDVCLCACVCVCVRMCSQGAPQTHRCPHGQFPARH